MFEAMDPNIPSTQLGAPIPPHPQNIVTQSLVHTTSHQPIFTQTTLPFLPIDVASSQPASLPLCFPPHLMPQNCASIPSIPISGPFIQAQSHIQYMPQITIGMPPVGPSSQPFTNPSSFSFAQSTIPSFPLGPQSFISSQPQTTIPPVGRPFLPNFQIPPPRPPSNPLTPITNYLTMPPLSRNPLPFSQ